MPNTSPLAFCMIWLNASNQVQKVVAESVHREFVVENVTGDIAPGTSMPNGWINFRTIEDLVGKYSCDVHLGGGELLVNIGPPGMRNSSTAHMHMDGDAKYLGLSGEWREIPRE
ncbi:hypothetical protein FRC12_008190 [Ceratobasidium sp. 428]|nr:hypothetical protein FRC12_008190 [Ceratobasidium sp. 428]